MTREEKRMKIAESCGLGSLVGFPDQRPIPDYFGSLDAMHEAEKVLNSDQCVRYGDWLRNHYGTGDECASFWGWHMPAAQRAEAFGLALGLWKEGE